MSTKCLETRLEISTNVSGSVSGVDSYSCLPRLESRSLLVIKQFWCGLTVKMQQESSVLRFYFTFFQRCSTLLKSKLLSCLSGKSINTNFELQSSNDMCWSLIQTLNSYNCTEKIYFICTRKMIPYCLGQNSVCPLEMRGRQYLY